MARHQFASVPISVVRSVVKIAEVRSISKAARSLGVSQPAISAQLKMIEEFVGGNIFQKSAVGPVVTELGKIVLIQARKILEANNQLQLLRGSANKERSTRVGVSELYINTAFNNLALSNFAEASIIGDSSAGILKGLINGFIDVGLFLQTPNTLDDPSTVVLHRRVIDLVWVRSLTFVSTPGAPIPLLTSDIYITHEPMIHALEKNGLLYRVAFSSSNHHDHVEAAARGLGITALPRSLIKNGLIEAKEYYLPPLPALTMCLGVRQGFDPKNNKFYDGLVSNLFSDAECSTQNVTAKAVGV